MLSKLFSSLALASSGSGGGAGGGRRRLLFYSTTTTSLPSHPKPHLPIETSSKNPSTASNPLSNPNKSPQNPQPFVDFMKTHGFTDAHIEKILSYFPKYLNSNVDRTLAPKFQSFRDLGFSDPDTVDLVLSNPGILHFTVQRIRSRIQFWRSVMGSNDHLIKLFKRGSWFLSSSIENTAIPNLSLLRDCRISDKHIGQAVKRDPRFILRNPKDLSAMVARVEGFGIPRGTSGYFLQALVALHQVSEANFDAKLKLMRSFGWSEAEFVSAFGKAPRFLPLSTKLLSEKMKFLMKEVGYEPAYIADHPVLLMHALERMIPRHGVLKILKLKGLLTREIKLTSVVRPSEKVFVEKYVAPYKEKVPELQEMYLTGFGAGGGV